MLFPLGKKYLHSTSVLASLSSFSNTSKVTIKGWLTQTSSPLTKKNLSPLKSGRTARVSKAFASFPPACQRGLGQQLAPSSTENRASKEEKNHTKLLGQLRWRGSTADGFLRVGAITLLSTRCRRCCPGMLPWDAAPPTPSSSFHGKGRLPHPAWGGRCGLAASTGEIWRNFYKFLWCETVSFAESVSGSWEGRRKLGKKNGKEKLLAKVVMFYRTFVGFTRAVLILQRNGPFPRQWYQNLNYIYIIITIAIYLSI